MMNLYSSLPVSYGESTQEQNRNICRCNSDCSVHIARFQSCSSPWEEGYVTIELLWQRGCMDVWNCIRTFPTVACSGPTLLFVSLNMSKDVDDTFELYDLRVEVIVTKGDQRRILCGANEGDYFELKGEMISLPDGKGFSLYSLGKG